MRKMRRGREGMSERVVSLSILRIPVIRAASGTDRGRSRARGEGVVVLAGLSPRLAGEINFDLFLGLLMM